MRRFLAYLGGSLTALALLLALGTLVSEQVVAQSPTGSLTIIQDTNPESNGPEFDYDFDPGSDFDLEDDDSVTKTLAPGTYDLQQLPLAGWKLDRFYCDQDIVYSVNLSTARVQLEVRAEDVITCTFVNVPIPPTPTATPVPAAPVVEPQVFYVPQFIFVPAPPPPPPAAQVAAVSTPKPVTQSIVRPPSTGSAGMR